MTILFAAGERIQTESAYKFAPAAVDRLAAQAGFALARSWIDERSNFAEHLLIVR
jgi:uncharacterized SAM-dependent methyltransferase